MTWRCRPGGKITQRSSGSIDAIFKQLSHRDQVEQSFDA
jgi:hypothetical protein